MTRSMQSKLVVGRRVWMAGTNVDVSGVRYFSTGLARSMQSEFDAGVLGVVYGKGR
jgi:hypothetical protein